MLVFCSKLLWGWRAGDRTDRRLGVAGGEGAEARRGVVDAPHAAPRQEASCPEAGAELSACPWLTQRLAAVVWIPWCQPEWYMRGFAAEVVGAWGDWPLFAARDYGWAGGEQFSLRDATRNSAGPQDRACGPQIFPLLGESTGEVGVRGACGPPAPPSSEAVHPSVCIWDDGSAAGSLSSPAGQPSYPGTYGGFVCPILAGRGSTQRGDTTLAGARHRQCVARHL